jgi:hypothetical protein
MSDALRAAPFAICRGHHQKNLRFVNSATGGNFHFFCDQSFFPFPEVHRPLASGNKGIADVSELRCFLVADGVCTAWVKKLRPRQDKEKTSSF